MQPESEFARRKVLVSGATGFLGSHLCRRLAALGAEIHAVSRNAHTPTPGVRWIRGDFKDLPFVLDLFRSIKPEYMFHLTSHSVGTPDLTHVTPTLENDLIPSVNALIAAAQTGCRRLLMAASLEEPQGSVEEAIPPSPYAAAKWAAGGYARMFHKLYGVPVVLVRPYMAYGPNQKAHKIIPHVCLSLLGGKEPVLGSGQRSVDWIYVDDVIDGMTAACFASGVEGQTIDLGSGTLVTIRDMVTQLAEISSTGLKPSFGALADRPMETVRAADTDTALRLLNWRAMTPLKEGLARTLDWFRATLAG